MTFIERAVFITKRFVRFVRTKACIYADYFVIFRPDSGRILQASLLIRDGKNTLFLGIGPRDCFCESPSLDNVRSRPLFFGKMLIFVSLLFRPLQMKASSAQEDKNPREQYRVKQWRKLKAVQILSLASSVLSNLGTSPHSYYRP